MNLYTKTGRFIEEHYYLLTRSFEVFSLISWIILISNKKATLTYIFIWSFIQLVTNGLYALYILVKRNAHSTFFFRAIYALSFLAISIASLILLIFLALHIDNTMPEFIVYTISILYCAMFSSMVLWGVNVVFVMINASDHVNRTVALGMIVCTVLGTIEFILNSVNGGFIFSIVIIIFGMRIITFGIDPDNAKAWRGLVWAKLGRKLYKYGNSSAYREKVCKAINFLVFPTTLFQVLCEFLVFRKKGVFLVNSKNKNLFEICNYHIPKGLLPAHHNSICFGSIIQNINYFPKPPKVLWLVNSLINIANGTVRICVSIMIILLISALLCTALFVVNILYCRFYNRFVE